MLNNIKRGEVETIEKYSLSFRWSNDPQAGFSFPCTKNGWVDLDENPAMIENLAACIFGIYDVDFEGIMDESFQYHNPDTGICDCGETVYLENDYGHGIDCNCGRIYSQWGQELAPRSQWEDRYDDDSTQPYWAEFGYGEAL
jgi:hypothetical protein